ncbi:FIG00433688: hypothetical protein [hydrothermal vent metagenome]|uniref:DUF1841 domain-containing protein n=1 Tax=hydrothermal vent metagenome TaxID=652676 RepID=A0A3B1A4D1_9ZZZZ
MIFSQNRDELRQFYISSWEKYRNKQPLEALESQIGEVVALHPEYHAFLEKGEDTLAKDFSPELGESNPFMHMGLHLGIREQLSVNRPTGITNIYTRLMQKHNDVHRTEHAMMECLAEMIWQAQRSGTAPDEQRYLEQLKKL